MFPGIEKAWKPGQLTASEFRIALGTGLFFFLLYALTSSIAPDEWDSVQFCFALDKFDLKMSQPHAPGYPLYVASGWLLRALGGFDNHRALTLASAIGGGLFLSSLFLIARSVMTRSWALAGVCAAGFSPVLWLNSIKAMTDVPASALLMVSVAFATASCLQRRPRLLMAAAACASLASGFRPQNSFILVVMLIAAASLGKLGWRWGGAALGIWAAGCLLWLVPTMALQAHSVDGNFWTAYWKANLLQFQWRFDKPGVYAGAAMKTDPWLLRRLDDHFCGWLTHGLGSYWSWTLWLLVPLILGGWTGALKSIFTAASSSMNRTVVFNACWIVPYILMIFIFLPADQRYYIPVLGFLAVLSVAGWAGWSSLPGKWTRYAALLIPALMLVVSAPLAWQSHVEPSPPIRAIQWLSAKIPPAERSSTLLVIRDSKRHLDYLQPGFRTMVAEELEIPGRWEENLKGVERVFTEVEELPLLARQKELNMVELIRFERSEEIQRKHKRVVLYEVKGWKK